MTRPFLRFAIAIHQLRPSTGGGISNCTVPPDRRRTHLPPDGLLLLHPPEELDRRPVPEPHRHLLAAGHRVAAAEVEAAGEAHVEQVGVAAAVAAASVSVGDDDLLVRKVQVPQGLARLAAAGEVGQLVPAEGEINN